jgi:hypothetical protein
VGRERDGGAIERVIVAPWRVIACPVCQGRGCVPAGFYGDEVDGTGLEMCRTCEGAGLLRVSLAGAVEQVL